MAKSEENKRKLIAFFTTLVLHCGLLLIFIVITSTTPIPPYPPGDGPGLELNFGDLTEGSGNVENSDRGSIEQSMEAVTPPDPNPSASSVSGENLLTNDAEESISVNSTPHEPKKKVEEKPIEKPQPKASQALLSALKALKEAKRQKASGAGGDGNSGNKGNSGHPDGDPNADGLGGGGHGFTVKLAGRKILRQPDIADDSQEEGKVVVAIWVNQDGKVIRAEPGQRGSTASSGILWTKARQAALSTRFNASSTSVSEQKGTMTFVFILN